MFSGRSLLFGVEKMSTDVESFRSEVASLSTKVQSLVDSAKLSPKALRLLELFKTPKQSEVPTVLADSAKFDSGQIFGSFQTPWKKILIQNLMSVCHYMFGQRDMSESAREISDIILEDRLLCAVDKNPTEARLLYVFIHAFNEIMMKTASEEVFFPLPTRITSSMVREAVDALMREPLQNEELAEWLGDDTSNRFVHALMLMVNTMTVFCPEADRPPIYIFEDGEWCMVKEIPMAVNMKNALEIAKTVFDWTGEPAYDYIFIAISLGAKRYIEDAGIDVSEELAEIMEKCFTSHADPVWSLVLKTTSLVKDSDGDCFDCDKNFPRENILTAIEHMRSVAELVRMDKTIKTGSKKDLANTVFLAALRFVFVLTFDRLNYLSHKGKKALPMIAPFVDAKFSKYGRPESLYHFSDSDDDEVEEVGVE